MIHWYPGHMTAAKRQLQKQLGLVDVVLLVLDARVPRASHNTELAGTGKPVIRVLCKADLADPAITRRWLEHFSKQGITLALDARTSPKALLAAIEKSVAAATQRAENKGAVKTVRVLAAGIPNAGKSTLLNSLAGRAKAATGNKPGVTRGTQWIHVTPYLELLDSPGLLLPRLSDQTQAQNLALTGAINDDILSPEELFSVLHSLLQTKYPQALSARYGVNAADFLPALCKARGYLLKGGLPDNARAARAVIEEFRTGKLGRITLETPEEA